MHRGVFALPMAATKTSAAQGAKEEAIAVIAAWATAVGSSQPSASAWAVASGLSSTTVTRGMAPSASGTTKIENLHLLARKAGVPSVLDFLRSQTDGTPLRWSPAPETIEAILRAALPALAQGRVNEDALRDASHEISTALAHLASRPEKEGNRDVLETLTDGIALALDASAQSTPRSASRKHRHTPSNPANT